MSWYKTGTVTVTNGSAAVTGAGTLFVGAVQAGDAFVGPNRQVYEVVAVISATQLTIAPAYVGSSQPGAAYGIFPTYAALVAFNTRLNTLLVNYESVLTGAGAGKFLNGTAALPSIAGQADTNTGLYFPGPDQIGASTGGARRWLLTNTAFQVDVPVTGTAAQSSPTDATAGKLLKVAGFGLGVTGFGSLLPSGDIDAVTTPSGEYRIDDNMSGVFPVIGTTTVDKFGMLRVSRRTSDEISQIYVTAGGLFGGNIMYHRTYITGTSSWSSWSMQYGTEQVLISPSKDGSGRLSGGLMSIVTNGNGKVYRYANGMQVCTHEITLNYATPDILAQSWIYPGFFTSPPICLVNLSNQLGDYTGINLRDVGQYFVNPDSPTVGTINLYRVAGAAAVWGATAAITKVRVTAIGERTL